MQNTKISQILKVSLVLLFITIIASFQGLMADTLYLRNGKKIENVKTLIHRGKVEITDSAGRRKTYRINQVLKIDRRPVKRKRAPVQKQPVRKPESKVRNSELKVKVKPGKKPAPKALKKPLKKTGPGVKPGHPGKPAVEAKVKPHLKPAPLTPETQPPAEKVKLEQPLKPRTRHSLPGSHSMGGQLLRALIPGWSGVYRSEHRFSTPIGITLSGLELFALNQLLPWLKTPRPITQAYPGTLMVTSLGLWVTDPNAFSQEQFNQYLGTTYYISDSFNLVQRPLSNSYISTLKLPGSSSHSSTGLSLEGASSTMNRNAYMRMRRSKAATLLAFLSLDVYLSLRLRNKPGSLTKTKSKKSNAFQPALMVKPPLFKGDSYFFAVNLAF